VSVPETNSDTGPTRPVGKSTSPELKPTTEREVKMTGCIISRPNKAILVKEQGDTLALFPGAYKLDHNGPHLVIPHEVPQTIMLRSLGFNVPNPMLCYYDFGSTKPFSVQRHTMDMMTTTARSYVLNSMGTGKTKATLWSWDYLHGNGLCGKMLVVATLSTLRFVWEAEAFKTLPHRKVAVLHGTKARRLERLAEDADIYVINHDGLKTIMPELLQRTDIDVLCLDEVAVYRNNSERSKDMRKFSTRFKVVWGLTGRPMPNEPTDVWGISKVVTPHTSPKYFRQAQEMLMNKINNFKYVPKPEAIERAMAMLQPNVRFALDQVVELPEVISRTIDVPLDAKGAKTYKVMADSFKVDVEKGTVTAVNAAVVMGKLLQISGGWVYAKLPSGVQISVPVFDPPMPRHQVLVDLINENERKVIVYVPFRHTIEGLTKVLDDAGIEHCVVHGDISGRGEIFNLFQHTDKYKVLLAHPQCVAHGLTLTTADTIIWYLPTTSLEIYEQANARITRVGQRHKQKVLHLQSTSVERKIYSLLQRKQKVQDSLLDLLAEATEAKLPDAA